ncbi:uncharacterized protein B0P05DRAFT_489893 [Gilbertella persicaria]|uniref:uncharacterized protein n=1 Tax=Gilbertella persicaria TaxID=101096 RepID=UPI00221E6592|nr:uncharacterized protein B0P05DRAFT_489893 [Gilbertella persicaria]KAI8082007.1 hypothetical protein B0P05DRAFT_489893 [Gilbertella persicaria]
MSPTTSTQQKPGQRKKKAARACIHCQKAHLTCDDSRPCQRCIKRDLANTCTDGARKKAKYLQDTDIDNISSTSNDNRYTQQRSSLINGAFNNLSQQQPFLNGANLFNTSQLLGLDTNNNLNYGFGSNATNLEYSILSNMLGSPQFLDNNTKSPSSASLTNSVWASSPPASSSNNGSGNSSNPLLQNNANTTPPASSYTSSTVSYLTGDPTLYSPQQQQMDPTTITVTKVENSPKSHSVLTTPPVSYKKQFLQKNTSNYSQCYSNSIKPFSYADGYHYLINYVRQKMGRDELMRISKALALFRPSVLASMMNLTEDDLIFTEKCLQRTLLEYEKLISYSGTPTVVWRRTGEIALVGKEFSLLTQWSRDAILSKKTYIYELMSNPSAVEYWEKYALHAFDNTDSAVYSSCILMSPTKRVVPCTFCFTIKRDIFDLPSVIVGNFLPILS